MNLQQLSDTEKSQTEPHFQITVLVFFSKHRCFLSLFEITKKLTPKDACSELSLTIKTSKCYLLAYECTCTVSNRLCA